MHLSYNLMRALSRLFAAGSGGSFVQYMVEVTVQEKPDHITWLTYTGIFFLLSLGSFLMEHRLKPPSRMHPDAIEEIRRAVASPEHLSEPVRARSTYPRDVAA
jgi:hypothetical protein